MKIRCLSGKSSLATAAPALQNTVSPELQSEVIALNNSSPKGSVSFHVIIQHIFMKPRVTECCVPTSKCLTALPLDAYISVVSLYCHELLDTQLSPLNSHQLSDKAY